MKQIFIELIRQFYQIRLINSKLMLYSSYIYILIKLDNMGFRMILLIFFKKDSIYKITRMANNHDSFLGISFAEKIEQNPEIIEVQIRNPKKNKNQSSKDEVLKQVIAGLKSVNQSLVTNYKLSYIYYTPFSDGPSSIYQILIRRLIIHYRSGNKFEEV